MGLNEDQFGKVRENTLAGGDTVNTRTGERPTKGYMVSDEGSEARVKAESLTTEKVVRHAVRHHDVLHGDPEAYMGTWRDAQYTDKGEMVPRPTDTVYLDVSRRYDNGFLAQLAGQREHQKAIYGIREETSIDVPVPGELRTSRARRRAEPHVERGM